MKLLARLRNLFSQSHLLVEVFGSGGQREILSHDQFISRQLEKNRTRTGSLLLGITPRDERGFYYWSVKRNQNN